uniref:NADH dehydrogenase [ubiquinone] 1 beta subcomplex subunit 2, mitochondrial n=1 Tax=Oncorhynchus tshawytscha TaxID=74940 RepID=A0A8C8I6D7_ONCTS
MTATKQEALQPRAWHLAPGQSRGHCPFKRKKRAGGGPHIEAQYRQFPQLTKSQTFQAELLSSAMWFWILWHCWHDPDAVMGHFPWPDASEWTDEELGIPADDEE